MIGLILEKMSAAFGCPDPARKELPRFELYGI